MHEITVRLSKFNYVITIHQRYRWTHDIP